MELFVRFVAVISALMWCGAAVDDEFVGETRTVCIRLGCLEGTTQPGYLTPAYEAFLGIPYAEPPIGVLRFAVSEINSYDICILIERSPCGHSTLFFIIFWFVIG